MTILLTGAGGQIGRELVGSLRAAGRQVVPTDLSPSQADRTGPEAWRALDVTDRDAVDALIAEVEPQVVYHLAAILSARGERDPALTYRVNQDGTYHVLESCRVHGVERVMFTSSIAVYGPGVPDPCPDEVALHPTTMYGVTKVGGELLGEYYRRRYRLDVRGVRFPGLISAGLPGGGTSDYALFMYVDAVRSGGYRAFCRSDTRIPLMYMPDAIRALAELEAADGSRLTRCVYNIAAFSPTAQAIADAVCEAVPGADIGFDPDPVRQAILDSWPRALDDSTARADWGWAPRYDLAGMTADLVPRVRELLARGALATHD